MQAQEVDLLLLGKLSLQQLLPRSVSAHPVLQGRTPETGGFLFSKSVILVLGPLVVFPDHLDIGLPDFLEPTAQRTRVILVVSVSPRMLEIAIDLLLKFPITGGVAQDPTQRGTELARRARQRIGVEDFRSKNLPSLVGIFHPIPEVSHRHSVVEAILIDGVRADRSPINRLHPGPILLFPRPLEQAPCIVCRFTKDFLEGSQGLRKLFGALQVCCEEILHLHPSRNALSREVFQVKIDRFLEVGMRALGIVDRANQVSIDFRRLGSSRDR